MDKADGLDVVPYVGESVRHRWSGYVDLNDGNLNKLYEAYCLRLQSIECVELSRKQPDNNIRSDLAVLEDGIVEDLTFQNKGTRKALGNMYCPYY